MPWLPFTAHVGEIVTSTSFPICSVRGMGKAFAKTTLGRRRGTAKVLLAYLRRSLHLVNGPGRAHGADCGAHWPSVLHNFLSTFVQLDA